MGQSTEELKRDIERSRDHLGDTLDAIGDRVSPGRMIERRKNRVRSGIHRVRDRVMGTASAATASLGDTADSALQTLHDAPGTVVERTEGSPIVVGALAFGVGFLLAATIPPSEVEQQASERVMDAVEPVKQELADAGQEMAQHLKQPVKDAVDDLRGEASGAAHEVAQTAKDATSDTAGRVVEAAQQVGHETANGGSDRPM